MSPEQRAAIEALLELLPSFEAPDFVPATWPPRFYFDEHGRRVENMPYPDYHPAIEEFRTRMGAFIGGVHPYDPLPEDAAPGGIEFNVLGTSFPMEYFATATANQIRRYFLLLNRGERFCDGHIEGEFRSGKVVAALLRLRYLLRADSGPT